MAAGRVSARREDDEEGVDTPTPGMIVGGKYRLLRPLGEGGMGAVYEAQNTLTLKRAAIKWMHPRVHAVPGAAKRLLYEARACARIRHRNVVDLYDVLMEGDSVFLVMELLTGEPLSRYLERVSVHVHDLVRLLLPAMRGVAAAHAAGVVHRDIKPDNIFLVHDDGSDELVPKVIDFGISLLVEPDQSRLTRSGMTMGTPRYVSYEQLRGARDVDRRADVYSFGVILYECIVGRPPYEATTLSEQAITFVTTEPPAPRTIRPELPEGLEAVLEAAIARDREERTASMEALIAGLSEYANSASYTVSLPAFAPQSSTPPADPVGCEPTTEAQELHDRLRPIHSAAVASLPSPRRPRTRLVALLAGLLGVGAVATLSVRSRIPVESGARATRGAVAVFRPRATTSPLAAVPHAQSGASATTLPMQTNATHATIVESADPAPPAAPTKHPAKRVRSERHAPAQEASVPPSAIDPTPLAPTPAPSTPSSSLPRRADPLSRDEF